MADTPEAKVKKMVRKVLSEFTEDTTSEPDEWGDTYLVPNLYQFWPVPSGFGASGLDCYVCYYSVSITIETKAPGKHPTPRQRLTIASLKAAKGLVFVIEDEDGCEQLRAALQLIRFSQHANDSKQ